MDKKPPPSDGGTSRLRLDLYPSEELRRALDRWRIEQPGAPSRAEAGRRLLEEVLTERGYFKATKPRKRAAVTKMAQPS